MSQQVLDYLESARKLAAARQRLTELLKTLRAVAKCFDGWEKVHPEAFNGQFDHALRAWPSREDLAAAVKAWQDASRLVAQAWDTVPANLRFGVTPPERLTTDG